jgi:hypothetical protein
VIEDRFTLRCERIKPDVPNLNNRTYPASVLRKMHDQVQKKLRIGVFFGRLGVFEATKVRMQDASHRVVDSRIEKDGHLAVDCMILNTPQGVVLETMIESMGVEKFIKTHEVLPCGSASTSVIEGHTVIGEDYRLASLDIEPKLVAPKEEPDEAHS